MLEPVRACPSLALKGRILNSPGLQPLDGPGLFCAAASNPGAESRVSALEAETPRRKPEIRLPKLQILHTKPEIHRRNAAVSDSSLSFWRGIHTFPDRSGEISDRSHTFWDRERDSLPENRDSGPEFIHSRTEVTPPGTEKRVSSPESRDSGVDPGACAPETPWIGAGENHYPAPSSPRIATASSSARASIVPCSGPSIMMRARGSVPL